MTDDQTPDEGAGTALPALADLAWPLRTARLMLRTGREEDAERIWPWYQDPQVQTWTTTLPASAAAHREKWTENLDSAVVALQGEEIIGVGMVRRGDCWGQADVADQARGQKAELGWVLDPGHQGRGLGTELAAALLDVAVDGLGVRRVEASCFAANRGSRRIMEKIGMRCEATFREDSLHRSGLWMDSMCYAVLASEHRASRGDR